MYASPTHLTSDIAPPPLRHWGLPHRPSSRATAPPPRPPVDLDRGRSGSTTSTEIIGVTDPVKVSWKPMVKEPFTKSSTGSSRCFSDVRTVMQ